MTRGSPQSAVSAASRRASGFVGIAPAVAPTRAIRAARRVGAWAPVASGSRGRARARRSRVSRPRGFAGLAPVAPTRASRAAHRLAAWARVPGGSEEPRASRARVPCSARQRDVNSAPRLLSACERLRLAVAFAPIRAIHAASSRGSRGARVGGSDAPRAGSRPVSAFCGPTRRRRRSRAGPRRAARGGRVRRRRFPQASGLVAGRECQRDRGAARKGRVRSAPFRRVGAAPSSISKGTTTRDAPRSPAGCFSAREGLRRPRRGRRAHAHDSSRSR